MTEKQSISPRRFTLANGLRVVHNYDPSTAMVAVDVLYDTGSRDESPEMTGIAHLFEHLMFAGSEHVEDFDGVLQDAGGTSNAWTSNDFTNFYEILPAQNIETAFYLESDRMLALGFREDALEIQRGVVIEEFKERVLNVPYGDIYHTLRSALYGQHPYAWPTIGKEPGHIEKVKLDDIRRWFYSHYAPNNAILSVSGNVAFERVRELAEKWFGDIPRREIATREPMKFNPADVRSYTEVESRVPQPMVIVAYPMAAYGKKGYAEGDTITDLLASGKASRFYRNLVAAQAGEGLIAQADASISGSEDTGMLMLTAILSRTGEEATALARKLLMEEFGKLAKTEDEGGCTEYELERVFNRFETEFRLKTLNCQNVATELAIDEYHGEDINERVNIRRTLKPEEVRLTAAELHAGPSATVVYNPEKEK
ncbi:MAG: insulinase family protein [Muribaculaceae bacterium]|nr:insulinase family protein [Muribaculaceae bacterium]